MCVLLVVICPQCWKNEGNAVLDHILMVDESWMHSFDPQLRRQNVDWCAQLSPRKKIAWRSQDALKVMHVIFFSRKGLVLDYPVPIGMTVNGQYYCALLQDKVRRSLHCQQSEPLERGVILLQDNATPHGHHDVKKLVQLWGWVVLAHPPYSPDLALCDYWFFACVKEHLWVSSLNQKTISTLLSLPLYVI
jgi:histone-lysine N-methyltransferase SETMAR